MATYEDKDAELVKIGNLNSYSRRVYTIVKVVSKTKPREVSGGAHRVAEALVGDDTGSIYLTLWDDALDKVKEGQILNIKNAYVNLFRGSMREGAISAAAAERCTKQSALTVGRNVKFRSSPQKAALSTARNALRNADHQEDGNKVSKGVRFRAGGCRYVPTSST